MTVLVDTVRYSRTPRLLCRDTGRHVLVLPREAPGEVLVLGGGGASVWRLLDEPRSLTELMDDFTVAGGSTPNPSSLAHCINELAEHGVIQVAREHA